MRIIEAGKIPKYIIKCKHCGTKFEYQKSEVQYGGVYSRGRRMLSVRCPLCDIDLC
jgi:hypothetical protein